MKSVITDRKMMTETKWSIDSPAKSLSSYDANCIRIMGICVVTFQYFSATMPADVELLKNVEFFHCMFPPKVAIAVVEMPMPEYLSVISRILLPLGSELAVRKVAFPMYG